MNRLRSNLLHLVRRAFIKQLVGDFTQSEGHGWTADISWHHLPFRRRDSRLRRARSGLMVYEDGYPLGPPKETTDTVETLGHGHFCGLNDRIVFSTSDNSDPNANGRIYTFSTARWLSGKPPRGPVNDLSRDPTPEAIEREIDRLIGDTSRLFSAIDGLLPSLEGTRVLEVEPGKNYGRLLLVACRGAIPFAIDPNPIPWSAAYHFPFFERLLNRIRPDPQYWNRAPVERILDEAGFSSITRTFATLEQARFPSGHFDLIFSNAALQHLYNTNLGIRQLYRMTARGGVGCHWIDFRDRRNPERPLEFLTLSEQDFWREFAGRHGRCGNRLRPEEVTQAFRNAGFDSTGVQPQAFVDSKYLRGLLPRLRSAAHSRYQSVPEDWLQPLYGRYLLQRPASA